MLPSSGPSFPAHSSSLALFKQVNRQKSSTFEAALCAQARGLGTGIHAPLCVYSVMNVRGYRKGTSRFSSLMKRICKGRSKGSFLLIVPHPQPLREKVVVLTKVQMESSDETGSNHNKAWLTRKKITWKPFASGSSLKKLL